MKLKSEIIIKSNNFNKLDRIVIFLHGYGSSGKDFLEIANVFLASKLDNTIFLFPDAPFNCGIVCGKKWFPLEKISYEYLRAGLDTAAPILAEYINDVVAEYGCNNVNLIGFSQGGAMCLEALFHSNISKIIAYSGIYAPTKNKNIINDKAKVLLVHCVDDEIVPYSNVTVAKECLSEFNIEPQIVTCCGIGHSISFEGWNAGVEFLK